MGMENWSVVRQCVPSNRPECRYDPVEPRFVTNATTISGWRVVHQKAVLCLVSDMSKLIFVAIPKNGFGTTETFMKQHLQAHRVSWSELNEKQRTTYFIVTWVRDPVERAVSAYNQVGLLKREPPEFQAPPEEESELARFRRFFRVVEQHGYQHGLPANGWDEHVVAQTVFLAGLNGWPVHLDLVAPLSAMADVWRWLQQQIVGVLPSSINITTALPRHNAASDAKGPNMMAYDLLEEQDHEMIRRIYQKDYDCLGPFLPPPRRADPSWRNAEREDIDEL